MIIAWFFLHPDFLFKTVFVSDHLESNMIDDKDIVTVIQKFLTTGKCLVESRNKTNIYIFWC